MSNTLKLSLIVFQIVLLFLPYGVSSQDKVKIDVKKLPSQINSDQADEYSPILDRFDTRLYFTRSKHPDFDRTLVYNNVDVSKTKSKEAYDLFLKDIYTTLGDAPDGPVYNSNFNQDIWYAEKTAKTFGRIHHLPYPVNSALPNSAAAVMPDGKSLLIINQFHKNGSMYKGFSVIAPSKTDQWEFPKPIYVYDYKEKEVQTDVNLCLSQNAEIMILSFSDNHSGNTDLFLAERLHKTLWGKPEKMPSSINSRGREFSPYLTADGRILFFSSNRDGSIGGSDIYMSLRLKKDNSEWSNPIKLKGDINTTANEGHPFYYRNKLFFASDRDGTWDIFVADFNPYTYLETLDFNLSDQEALAKFNGKQKPTKIAKKKEEVVVKNEVEKRNTRVLVRLVNSTTKKTFNTKVSLVDANGVSKEVDISDKGRSFEWKDLQRYEIVFAEEKFISKKWHMSNHPQAGSEFFDGKNINLNVDPFDVGSKIDIGVIRFRRSTDRILSESYDELDELYHLMKKKRSLKIKIEGHTDNVGTRRALINLSRKRAIAIKRYLVRKGIQSFRIETAGYGSDKPLAPNDSEQNKQKNRRVEIIITNL